MSSLGLVLVNKTAPVTAALVSLRNRLGGSLARLHRFGNLSLTMRATSKAKTLSVGCLVTASTGGVHAAMTWRCEPAEDA